MASKGNAAPTIDDDSFRDAFARMQSLIVEEWPDIEERELGQTEGDLGQVVELVAGKTKHTKTLVRRQLAELHQVAAEGGDDSNALSQVKKAIKRLETRTAEITSHVREELLPTAQAKVRENMLLSLFVALGLGFLLGFVLRGGRGRR